jgi:hypothetical protein
MGVPWKEVNGLERPSDSHNKAMLTAFFNGIGEYFLHIFPGLIYRNRILQGHRLTKKFQSISTNSRGKLLSQFAVIRVLS